MIKIYELSLEIKKKTILESINIEINKGEIVGLVGRNGSGKTMLMKCICGFVKPTEGYVSVNAKVIGTDVDFPPDMGLIIETPTFINNYSGYKNLKILAKYNNKIGDQEIRDILKRVKLYADKNKHVSKYSLGMKQRLAIAQAVMENPEILVLDEPMNGLDKEGVQEMRKLFLELKASGKTIVLASHNKEDIEILCDHVYEMEHGCVNMLK